MSSFFNPPNFKLVKKMLYVDFVSLDIHKQHDLVLHNINKDCLYVVILFLFSMRGLNFVSSICMGSFNVVDRIGWGGMEAMKFLCNGNGFHGENTLQGGHFGHFHNMYVIYISTKLVTLNFGFQFWYLGLIF
jgi:hypothetical protein